MGPRSTERGRMSRSASTSRIFRASMGPRSTERGRCHRASSGNGFRFASMGPRSTERGRVPGDVKRRLILVALQWGRAQQSAEGSKAGQAAAAAHPGFNGAALNRARKEERRRGGRVRPLRASMGPRSTERGRRLPSAGREAGGELQWGRAQQSAEGRWEYGACDRWKSFNGAALNRARKERSEGPAAIGWCGFNGAALNRARKVQALTGLGEAIKCFNGAALNRARKEAYEDQARRRLWSFNGAALNRA